MRRKTKSIIWIAIPLFSTFTVSRFPSYAAESNLPSVWQDAEYAYKNGEYLKAAELYNQDGERDPSGWTARYNAGNSYFKAGRISEALDQYWRSYWINARSAELRHNLRMALERANDSLAPEGIPAGLYIAWRFIAKEEWIAIALILWWIFAAALWALKFTWLGSDLRIKRKLRSLGWTAGICLALSLGITLSHVATDQKKWGIHQGPGLLRSGPSANLPVTVQIPEGRFIWILEEQEGWTLVKTRKEGLRGWLR